MTKKRNREYGPKPQDVELKREEIPQKTAKLSANYCKKGKANHIFELESSTSYPRLFDVQTYQCTVCGKKKRVLKRVEEQNEQ